MMNGLRHSPKDTTPSSISGKVFDVKHLRPISPRPNNLASTMVSSDVYSHIQPVGAMSVDLIDMLSPSPSGSVKTSPLSQFQGVSSPVDSVRPQVESVNSSGGRSVRNVMSPVSARSQLGSVISPVSARSQLGSVISPDSARSQLGSVISPVSARSQLGSVISPVSAHSQLGSVISPVSARSQLGSVISPVSARPPITIKSDESPLISPHIGPQVSTRINAIKSDVSAVSSTRSHVESVKPPVRVKKTTGIPPISSHLYLNKETNAEIEPGSPKDENPYYKHTHESRFSANIRYIPPPTHLVHGYSKKVINYSIPDYFTMDLDERMIHRTDLANKLAALRSVYTKMDIPAVKDSLDPQYLRLIFIQYMGINEQVDANSSIDMYRFCVVVYLMMLELFVTNVLKIDVSGMSSKFYKSRWMSYYESAMREMCETGSMNFTEGWSPILKIAFYGLIQTVAIVIVKMLYTWMGPTAGSIVEQLIMHFMGTNESIINQPNSSDKEVPNLNTGIPGVSQASNMPNFGGLDVNSILTGLTGMFNGTSKPSDTQQETNTSKGPKYKR